MQRPPTPTVPTHALTLRAYTAQREMYGHERTASIRGPSLMTNMRAFGRVPTLAPLPTAPEPPAPLAAANRAGNRAIRLPPLEATGDRYALPACKCETTTSIAFRPMDTQGVRCFNVPRKFGKPRDSHTEYRELVQRQWNLAHAHQGKPPN